MLEKVEESLDLVITLKDALRNYKLYLQSNIEKCQDATARLPELIRQIEALVGQETELSKELDMLRDELGRTREQHRSLESDLLVVAEVESLEERIRGKEQARDELLQRLGAEPRHEGKKLLDLDIAALVEFREHQLHLLKERKVDRDRIKPLLDSLEGKIGKLTQEINGKTGKVRQLGELRQRYTEQFNKLKVLNSDLRGHQRSLANLEQLTQITDGIVLNTESVQPGTPEGKVEC
jgi:chromosome segregation ATPase